MAIRFLGGASFEVVKWHLGAALDSSVAGGVAGEFFTVGHSPVTGKFSKYGMRHDGSLDQQAAAGAFLTPTKNWISHHIWAKAVSTAGSPFTALQRQGFLTGHPTGQAAPIGTVRLEVTPLTSTSYRVRASKKTTATVWALLTSTPVLGATISIPESDYHLWTLMYTVDGSGLWRVYLDGALYLSGTHTAVAATYNGTPCPSGISTGGYVNWDVDCLFSYEHDSDGEFPADGITNYGVWANVPRGDVAGNLWTPRNSAGVGWRALDDLYDLDDIDDDYIDLPLVTPADKDSLFTLNSQDAGNIGAVGIAAVFRLNHGQEILKNLLAQVGASGPVQALTPVFNGALTCGYATMNGPDGAGAAWTLADFNALRAGVRNNLDGSGGSTPFRCYGLAVNTVGSGLARPADAGYAENFLRRIASISIREKDEATISIKEKDEATVSLVAQNTATISIKEKDEATISIKEKDEATV